MRTQGRKEADAAKALGTNVNTVSPWSKRFETGGLEALSDRKGRGRKPWLPPEKVRQVISRVTQPPKGRKKWSTRRMAAEVGISHHSVHEIWRRNDLKPHLVRTFKISNDPTFEEKFWDVIGLYLNPPDRSLVLCCGEKSQALAIHVIADKCATHKHANVKAWLKKHPRFCMHFTSTGSSWMNLVERFFADLTGDCIREGSFRSVRELIDAAEEYLADRNANPKRYVWRAKGEEILRKIAEAKEILAAQLQPAISNK